jgi:hypothetical protein
MWNSGYDSEYTQVMQWNQRSEADANILEIPGQFSYHARWQDGVTNHGHQLFQIPYNEGSFIAPQGLPPLTDEEDVASLDVAGYDLIAFGSPRTKGQDLDNSLTYTGAFGGPVHANRTGYLTLGQERNPYVTDGLYPNVQDYDERSYPTRCMTISSSTWAVVDKKVGNPQISICKLWIGFPSALLSDSGFCNEKRIY